jgi:quinolinate synthase
MSIIDEINDLKKKKNAVILSHYYVNDEIKAVSDYTGDSYYLSKIARDTDADIIVLCGVSFMGESAKLLNPDKKVLLPDITADCPMAHMASVDYIEKMRSRYDDLAVVCYINSTSLLKCSSDVCVTSANALKVVSALPNKNILFIPDENLGRYVANQLPDKNFIFNRGFCPIHKNITAAELTECKDKHPDAEVLSHPECTPDVLAISDYIGSTSGILKYAGESARKSFIICTECGILYELREKYPDKTFYTVGTPTCIDMKKVTLEKVLDVLRSEKNEVFVDDALKQKALAALDKMLELAN